MKLISFHVALLIGSLQLAVSEVSSIVRKSVAVDSDYESAEAAFAEASPQKQEAGVEDEAGDDRDTMIKEIHSKADVVEEEGHDVNVKDEGSGEHEGVESESTGHHGRSAALEDEDGSDRMDEVEKIREAAKKGDIAREITDEEELSAPKTADDIVYHARKEFIAGGLKVDVHLNTRPECHEDTEYPYVILSLVQTSEARAWAMLKHAKVLGQQCSIHELHIWNFTADDEGRLLQASDDFRANVPALWHVWGNPEERLARLAWSGFYMAYDVQDPIRTVLVRVNDDMLLLDPYMFRQAVQYRVNNQDWLMVVPNIVNDRRFAEMQQNRSCIPQKSHGVQIITSEYYTGHHHHTSSLNSMLVHEAYLKNASCFGWKSNTNDGCEEIAHQPTSRASASIYFLHFPKMPQVHELVSLYHGDEQYALFEGVADKQHRNCVYTNLAAMHTSHEDADQDIMKVYPRLYTSLLDSSVIGEPPAVVGKKVLKGASVAKMRVKPPPNEDAEEFQAKVHGICPRSAPQLDLNTCRAFAKQQPRAEHPSDEQLRAVAYWADFKSYIPAACLTSCDDTETQPVHAPLLWSDKYKFVWVQPPKAVHASVIKLLKEWSELEVQSGTFNKTDLDRFRGYKIISGVRNPMELFYSRYEALVQSMGVTAGAASPGAVGAVFSDLVRLIWPGCEATIDGSIKPTPLQRELSPVFLQWGGRPVDYLVHAETADDDLRQLWKHLGVPEEIPRPRLAPRRSKPPLKGAKAITHRLQQAIQRTIQGTPEVHEAFCTVYAVDYLCFGYENEFKKECGSINPGRPNLRTTSLKLAIEPPEPEVKRSLVNIQDTSCNIDDNGLIKELPFVEDLMVCEAHCQNDKDCFAFEHNSFHATCRLSKFHPDVQAESGITCSIMCEDSDHQLAIHLDEIISHKQALGAEPKCHEVTQFCDSRTVARFCPVSCHACEGKTPALTPGLISLPAGAKKLHSLEELEHRFAAKMELVQSDALEDMVQELRSQNTDAEKELEPDEDTDLLEPLTPGSPRTLEFNNRLTVKIHPNPRSECLPKRKSLAPFIIMTVFDPADHSEGEELSLIEKYAMKLAEQCSIHELHIFWTIDQGIDRWMEMKSFYQEYPIMHESTVIFKADDNLVYIDVRKLDIMAAHAVSDTNMQLVLPNLVNSGVGAYHQTQHGCLSKHWRGIELLGRVKPAMENSEGILHGLGSKIDPVDLMTGVMLSEPELKGLLMHEIFLKIPSCFSWKAPTGNGCVPLPQGLHAGELGSFMVRYDVLTATEVNEEGEEQRGIIDRSCLVTQTRMAYLHLDPSKPRGALDTDHIIYKLYDQIFGLIAAGDKLEVIGPQIAHNLGFDDDLDLDPYAKPKEEARAIVQNVGVCPRAAPQLDLSTCRRFGVRTHVSPVKFDMTEWANLENYIPAKCLSKCDRDSEIPATGEILVSNKYKFIWMSPPRSLGSTLQRVLLEFKELEVERVNSKMEREDLMRSAKMYRDYKILSSTTEPLRLFKNRMHDVYKHSGGEKGPLSSLNTFMEQTGNAGQLDQNAAKAVGNLLSDLLQQVWPGCESLIGHHPGSVYLRDIAPAFLQYGGRHVDFLVREEWLDEDIPQLWDYLKIPSDVQRPVLRHQGMRKQYLQSFDETRLNNTLVGHPDLRKAFCTAYSVDYICMGYHQEFEQLCSRVDPTSIKIAATKTWLSDLHRNEEEELDKQLSALNPNEVSDLLDKPHVPGLEDATIKAQDKSPLCKAWSEQGECENQPHFMDENCPRSCLKQRLMRQEGSKGVRIE